MAFDRPIEADRVDDLGLLSSFVRAPVLGPLLWILGGNRAKKLDDMDKVLRNQSEMPQSVPNQIATNVDREESSVANQQTKLPDLPRQVPPEIASLDSDSSSSEDEGQTLTNLSDSTNRNNNQTLTRCKRSGSFTKKSRRMSWSDETGKNLVQYCDESQTGLHEPPSLASLSPSQYPVKSAMRRTRSLGLEPHLLSRHPSQCVPSGLAGGGGGLVMPTMKQGCPGAGGSGSNGYISPQWGWYISTTPPTPEKYYAGQKKGLNHSQIPEHASLETETLPASTPAMQGLSHTPVFTRGLKGVPKKSVTGWPSVPL